MPYYKIPRLWLRAEGLIESKSEFWFPANAITFGQTVVRLNIH